jgi:hypothetical protein
MARPRSLAFVFCLCFGSFALASRAHADPVADLGKYSVFTQVDLGSLAAGKVLTMRSPSLGFARDLSVQAVYLVHAPVARTLDMHRQWNATRHSDLKVYLHHDFSGHPTAADFNLSIPGNSAVRRLAEATEKLPSTADLQLSKEEAASFKNSGGGGDFPPSVRDFWSQVLFHRATAFVERGLSGLPPYDSGEGARVSDEVSRLIREQPNVRAAFGPIIGRSPLGGAGGAGSGYYELFDVEGQAAFSLGASYSGQTGDTAQMLDLQYYASGGYYTYFTLYQMWPVTVGGKPATLVWRVDTMSSLELSDLPPFQRMGSGSAMMADVRRIITYFQKDMGR